MSIDKLASCIPDFQPYLGNCRFKDCVHLKEPDCAVKQAVEAGEISAKRYQHYAEVAELIASARPRY